MNAEAERQRLQREARDTIELECRRVREELEREREAMHREREEERARAREWEREREVVRGQLAREKETHETLLRQFDAQLHESTTVKAEVETLVQRLEIEHKQWAAEKMLFQERITDAQASLSEQEIRAMDLERELLDARGKLLSLGKQLQSARASSEEELARVLQQLSEAEGALKEANEAAAKKDQLLKQQREKFTQV